MRELTFSVIGLLVLFAPSGSRAQNFWEYVAVPRTWGIGTSIATGPGGEVIVSSFDGVLISANNGDIWRHSPIEKSNPNFSVDAIAQCLNGSIYAESYGFGLFLSKDNGNTWEQVNCDLPFGNVKEEAGIAIDRHGAIYVGNESVIVLSLDSGNNWQRTDPCGLNQIGYITTDSSDNVYIGGTYETSVGPGWGVSSPVNIFKSHDSGKTWDQIGLNLTNDSEGELFAIAVDEATKTIFAGTTAGLYRSINGSDWTAFDSLRPYITGISVTSPSHVFVGTGDGVYYSTNDGDTWVAENSGLTAVNIYALASDSSGRLFVYTDSGLFRSIKPQSRVEQSYESTSITLTQNSPNPFTQSTNISFTLNEPSFITLKLFNPLGSEVAALANGFFDQGEHEITFDRGDLPDGVYFYRLEANGQSQTRSFVVLR